MEEMSTKIEDWITQELNIRGWSVRELARRARLAHATINSVLSGDTQPGLKFYRGIAQAFRTPLAIVLQRAGENPSLPEDKIQDNELLSYFHALPEAQRRNVVTTTRALHEEHAEYRVRQREEK